MARTKESYQVSASDLPGVLSRLNFVLARIAERLDQMEGIRGEASIASDLDMNGNDLLDVGAATFGGAVTFNTGAITFASVTFQGNIAFSANVSIAGTLTFGDLAFDGDMTLEGSDLFIEDADGVVIHSME